MTPEQLEQMADARQPATFVVVSTGDVFSARVVGRESMFSLGTVDGDPHASPVWLFSEGSSTEFLRYRADELEVVGSQDGWA